MKTIAVLLLLISSLVFGSEEIVNIEKLHKNTLYPVVRVRHGSSGGSGTVLFSKDKEKGKFATYVLTNRHVVANAITINQQWDSEKKMEVKKEKRETVTVEIFQYKDLSKNVGRYAIDSDIIAHSEEKDLALLKLRSQEKVEFVAKLLPEDKIDSIKVFQKVLAVGCSLGHPPIATSGEIMSISDEIDGESFHMTNASIIFGNSGGAMFLDKTHEFIGVPSRVAGTGFTVVTHMGFFIPLQTVYNWLKDINHRFIFEGKE